MENGKNGHSSPKTHPRAKLPITNPLKFGSPVFRVLTETQNWWLSLWKMGKMAVAAQKRCPESKTSNYWPPLKFGSPVFWVLMETQNWCRLLWKMGKMAIAPQKRVLEWNFHLPTPLPITDPPKVWVSGFLSVDGNAKSVSAITENGKNGHSSTKTHPRAKRPFTDPLKFGSPHESVLVSNGFHFTSRVTYV